MGYVFNLVWTILMGKSVNFVLQDITVMQSLEAYVNVMNYYNFNMKLTCIIFNFLIPKTFIVILEGCQCNNHATTCDSMTGDCHCETYGIIGDQCEICDGENNFYGNATLDTCYC
jgi:hypothetical protein